jgi:hypothetical protein
MIFTFIFLNFFKLYYLIDLIFILLITFFYNLFQLYLKISYVIILIHNFNDLFFYNLILNYYFNILFKIIII